MPGIVQATEFKSCSSHPSAESLKVSMGKRNYQTKDKGDFSFPITKLGEDLVLAFVDVGGNEMARVDIRLVQIIEKGCWDEVFPLDGDGHVHMKLQVILNAEDRNRIRVMRESAMKKKQEMNPNNINLRLLQTASSVETLNTEKEKASDSNKRLVQIDKEGPNIEGPLPQAGPPFADSRDTYQKEAETIQEIQSRPSQLRNSQLILQIQVKTESPRIHGSIPDAKIKIKSPFANVRSDVQQGAVLRHSEPAIPNKNIAVPQRSKDDLSRISQNQSPLKTTPSNVKKMISAFEKTQVQEVKSLRKSMSVPSQLNRAGKGNLRELQESKVSSEPDEQTLRKSENQFISQNLHQTTSSVNREPDIVPNKTEQTLRKSEDQFISQNLHQTTSTVNHEPDIVPNKTEQAETPKEFESNIEPKPFVEKASPVDCSSGAAPRETMVKNSEISAPIVLPKYSTLETAKKRVEAEEFGVIQANNSYANRLYSSESLAIERTEICFKSSHKENIPSELDLLEKHDLKQESKYEMEKDQNKSTNEPKSGAGSSPHDSSNKLVGQVIKIVVILGFGVLVLLTRQKEPRKKSREVKVDLFTVPDYYAE